MQAKLILGSALLSAIAIGTIGTASAESMGKMDHMGKMGKMGAMEKCYGINAAYKNDCKSPGHSCAGQDAVSRDPRAFVAVPAGLCMKIDGGKTHPAG